MSDQEKMSWSERVATLRAYVQGYAKVGDMAMPYRYGVLESPSGVPSLCTITGPAGDGEIAAVNGEHLLRCLAQYFSHPYVLENYQGSVSNLLGGSTFKRVTEDVLRQIPGIRFADVAPVSFKSDKGYTFCKLPFDPVRGAVPSQYPLCAGFIERLAYNRDAFMAFIGSIFVKDSTRHQYLYISGGGEDGKSTLSAFFVRLMASVVSPIGSMPTSDTLESFVAYKMLGKRLGIFNENPSPEFTQSAIFKSISGDDWHMANQKFKDAFMVKVTTKFMFLSNEPLSIQDGSADKRRAIYAPLGRLEGPKNALAVEAMLEEAPAFIGACLDVYERIVDPLSKQIPVEEQSFEETTELCTQNYDSFWGHYFDFDDYSEMSGATLMRIFKQHDHRIGVRDKRRFIQYGQKHYPFKKVRGPNNTVLYKGIKPRFVS